eukprot:TRINITY_DN1886_c0_g1_i7.p3 TRINITY_DN1886_c0_g1~~TRINITY_DN1886_c0_g1_i7.p3  ORF type:complete len:278 (-),score=31.67 TRINITY_DN1886_c0_g1_i7:2172-3005(-)
MGSLAIESYQRGYSSIVDLQKLSEIEEIAECLKGNESKLIVRKRQQARLMACEKKLSVWEQILGIRQLAFTKVECQSEWIQVIKMAIKEGLIQHANRIMRGLKNELKEQNKVIPIEIYMLEIESQIKVSENKNEMKDIIKSNCLNHISMMEELDQKAQVYTQCGIWLKQLSEDLNQAKMEEIQNLFWESIKCDPNYYKSWNEFANISYEIVQILGQTELKKKYAIQAAQGFLKAIGLDIRHVFQNSLRLLTLLFQFGDHQEIADQVRSSFKTLNISV